MTNPKANRVTIVVFEGGDGFRWRAVAGNGRKKYTSGEAYFNRRNAIRAARDHADELVAGERGEVRIVQEIDGKWIEL